MDEEGPAETNQRYAVGLARAFGGAVIFAFPLIMTLEMWSLGVSVGRGRLLLFITANFALLVGLSYFAGFEKTFSWKEDLMDALAAFGVGVVASAIMLALFAVISLDMTWSEIVGKVALQSVPASIGAMLGRKQLGGGQDTAAEEERKREAGYGGELFLMIGGALFLAFNVAPTEEMILIAYQMTPLHGVALGLVSIALLHVLSTALGSPAKRALPRGVVPIDLSSLHPRWLRHRASGEPLCALDFRANRRCCRYPNRNEHCGAEFPGGPWCCHGAARNLRWRWTGSAHGQTSAEARAVRRTSHLSNGLRLGSVCCSRLGSLRRSAGRPSLKAATLPLLLSK